MLRNPRRIGSGRSTCERRCPAFPLVRASRGTGWQVKDSNLCSSRDGFTVWAMRSAGQRGLGAGRNFSTDSPQNVRHQPITVDANRTRARTNRAALVPKPPKLLSETGAGSGSLLVGRCVVGGDRLADGPAGEQGERVVGRRAGFGE